MASRRMLIAGRRCACTGLRSFPFCRDRWPGKAQPPPGKIVAHGAGCPLPGGAALAPAYVLRSFPFCGARRPGKAQPPPGKIVAHGAGCPLPGGAALAPACGPSPSSRVPRPGKAQPTPGKIMAHGAGYPLPGGAALAPACGPSPSVEFAGPVRRSRHRGVRLPYQSSSWPRMRNIS